MLEHHIQYIRQSESELKLIWINKSNSNEGTDYNWQNFHIPVSTIRSSNNHRVQRFGQVKPSHNYNGLPLVLQKGKPATTCLVIMPQLLRNFLKISKSILFENWKNKLSIHLNCFIIYFNISNLILFIHI